MKTAIYLDNAATTKTYKKIINAMLPYFTKNYGNPSSIYEIGIRSKIAINKARKQIANILNAKQEEIYFTSGGSESNNWALKSIFNTYKKYGNHIITTKIEHHSILYSCKYLEKYGANITYLNVNKNGIININDLLKAINSKTILVSIMFANNEIGSIQPIEKIGNILKENNILFHTDAVQAFCQIPINVNKMNIDMLTSSSHKINGPKGIGFLYVRNNIKIDSFIHGGMQEKNKRAGTENVPNIIGYSIATKYIMKNFNTKNEYKIKLRNYFINRILNEIKYTHLNGDNKLRLSNNINISFKFIEGESLLAMLNLYGIAASSGSACASNSLDPSHVLLAIGLTHEIAHGSIRITINNDITKTDLDYTINKIKKSVNYLRKISPLYDDYKKRKLLK